MAKDKKAKKARERDLVSRAYRSKIWQIGPVSIHFYRMMPDQFRHSPWRFIRVRLHLQWGPRCLQMVV